MNNITHRLRHVLPAEADVAAYREHGFWLSDIVLPPEILGAAERGMKRFYAGERDRPGPPGLEGDGWHPENGDVLRKNDYASLRLDELSALVAYPAIGAMAARLSGATGIRLWHDQLLFKPVGRAPGRWASVGSRSRRSTCTSQAIPATASTRLGGEDGHCLDMRSPARDHRPRPDDRALAAPSCWSSSRRRSPMPGPMAPAG